MRLCIGFGFLAVLVGCNGGEKIEPVDYDGDGYNAATDCDDYDAAIHPDADEVCDAIDNDCDGEVDEEAVDMISFFTDADGDGFGDSAAGVMACEEADGIVADDTDCDDTNETVNPGAQEVCDADAVDEDCDGLSDDADDSVDESTQTLWFVDGDKDSFGDAADVGVLACQDLSDEDNWYSTNNADCDDEISEINPDAQEVCDEDRTDEDCDGLADDDDPDTEDATKSLFYADVDQDNYGDSADAGSLFCGSPSTSTDWFTDNNLDCDDSRGDISPNADEICDTFNIDEDCDGIVDDEDDSVLESSKITFYVDDDRDSYGDENDSGVRFCDNPTTGSQWYSADNTDCNDDASDVNPGEDEVCDALDVDEDCDGDSNDDDSSVVGRLTYYIDGDGDLYGDDSDAGTEFCDPPSNYTLDNSDCDDSEFDVNPAATEVCDSDDVDEDCNGVADDLDSAVSGQTTFYLDNDLDNYGDEDDAGEDSCDAPAGRVADNTDCDDAVGGINPGATEVCDSRNVDEDCDGDADDDDASVEGTTTYYADTDMDMYGDENDGGTEYCDPPSNTSIDNTDCDDSQFGVNPGATEITGDGSDQNCDGGEICYLDADDDGYRPDATSTVASADADCTDATEALATEPTTDCNDGDGAIRPGVAEVAGDSVDQNCDGLELCFTDADDDGFRPDATSTTNSSDTDCLDRYEATSRDATNDCNDTDPSVYPGATETIADGIDQDCDGGETCYVDADNDGYRPDATSTVASADEDCRDPGEALGTEPERDCNDGDFDINPGRDEICDGKDNDCNATTLEDGLVRLITSTGTADYAAGALGTNNPAAPWTASYTNAREWHMCKGTYYINHVPLADQTFIGMGSSRSDVVLHAGTTNKGAFNTATSGIQLSFENLTISEGEGSTSGSSSESGGIGCNTSVTDRGSVTVKNVLLSGHSGYFGSAIHVNGCDLYMEDSYVVSNSSDWGAVRTVDSNVSLFSTSFDSNTGTSNSALYVWGATTAVSLEMDKVLVSRNNLTGGVNSGAMLVGGNGGKVTGTVTDSYLYRGAVDSMVDYSDGLVVYGGSDLTWEGVSSTWSGMIDNEYRGVSFVPTTTNKSVFRAKNADFGSPALYENGDVDISTVQSEYMATDNVSFVCNSEFCGNDLDGDDNPDNDAEDCLVGHETINWNASGYFRADSFLADKDSTIESFDAYLQLSGTGCTVDFYLLSNPGTTATDWTVEWSQIGVASSSTAAQWLGSSQIGRALEDGTYYALGYGFRCTSGNVGYGGTSSSGRSGGIGTFTNNYWSNSYSTPFTVGSQATDLTMGASALGYNLTSWTTYLDGTSALCP